MRPSGPAGRRPTRPASGKTGMGNRPTLRPWGRPREALGPPTRPAGAIAARRLRGTARDGTEALHPSRRASMARGLRPTATRARRRTDIAARGNARHPDDAQRRRDRQGTAPRGRGRRWLQRNVLVRPHGTGIQQATTRGRSGPRGRAVAWSGSGPVRQYVRTK